MAMATVRSIVSRDLFDGFAEGALQALDNSLLQQLPQRSELLPGSGPFPEQLLELKDIPAKLYVLGNVGLLKTPAIAIVGARKATAYGLECAGRFARRAARRGITVVSGGAIGCDMAAHQGALAAGGKTVVVLGSGADVVYPLRARELFLEVLAAGGTLLSEAPWGSKPHSWAFSKRNRIIAALAKATLIVEAGLPSGTFQTADYTLALGNEILVVPGPIFSATCAGTNHLLLHGALPVVNEESFDDALDMLFGPVSSSQLRLFDSPASCLGQADATGQLESRPAPSQESACASGSTAVQAEEDGASLNPQELKLRQLSERISKDLAANPMTIDALAGAYNREVMEIIRVISRMEISGLVERLRDGRYMTSLH